MKKRMLVLAMAATLCLGSTVSVFAATPCGKQCNKNNYVDANNDGVCDNFVDKDGDGVNDNCTGTRKNKKNSQGKKNGTGHGKRNGSGCGNGNGCGRGRNR